MFSYPEVKMNRWLRYMGYYSNVCRGKRKRQNIDGADFIITDDPDDQYIKGCNKSWARLIKKIYEVDPLICPIWGAPHIVTLYILSQVWGQYEDYCLY